MKKILVTGAGGFIGGHLVDELRIHPEYLGPDTEVFLQVQREKSAEDLRRDGWSVVAGDLTSPELCTQLPDDLGCVLHIAGLAGGSAGDLEKANVQATENLLRSMEIRHVPELVFMSTVAVYKESESPISEEGEISPSTAYGHSKYAAELLIQEKVNTKALRSAVILRSNNIYGPSSDHGMMAAFMKAVRKGEPILLDGDGSQVREPVYVDDVVRAIKASARKDGTGCAIYNISGSEAVTLADLAKRIHAIAGKEILVMPSGKPPVPPLSLRLDISKARQELGWQPRVRLEDGLKKTWESIMYESTEL
ncbi:NAD(P)-dependent oxidoreductase [Candidatus Kaiserbacteria bacterium]|nr:NAD(P)-dependent oxidoreductase [Candidatus Kaiserbacteria bacterium]